MTDDEILNGLPADILAAAPLDITFRPETAFALAGLIQLALRHPGMTPAPRAAGETFLAVVAAHFAAAPAVSEVLRRGNDPAYDEPPRKGAKGRSR
jgi:hypothetical protein